MSNREVHKRIAKFACVLLSIPILYSIYDYAWWHIERVDRSGILFDGTGRFFSGNFPTRREIEKYLNNNTFLLRFDYSGNVIEYFRDDGTYITWHQYEFEKRRWFLRPILYRQIYLNGWKIDLVYTFCMELAGNTFMDGCHIVENMDHILPYQRNVVDRRAGDIFSLSQRMKIPSELPSNETTISRLYDWLEHEYRDSPGKNTGD